MARKWSWAAVVLGVLCLATARGQGPVPPGSMPPGPVPPGPVEPPPQPGAFGIPPGASPEFCPDPSGGGFLGLGPITKGLPANGFVEPRETPIANAFDDCGLCGDCMGCRPWFWAGAEFMQWYTRRSPLATPLVTTSTSGVSDLAVGTPNNRILAGLTPIDTNSPNGGRFTIGLSCSTDWRVGVEVVYTYLHDSASLLNVTSNNGQPLGRPLLSTTPGNLGERAITTAGPGLVGTATVESSWQINSWQARGILACCEWGNQWAGGSLDLLAGARYMVMDEKLATITNTTPVAGGSFLLQGAAFGQGNTLTIYDSFRTQNEFVGGEFGVRFECRRSHMFISFEPKIGVGYTRQSLAIRGESSVFANNGGDRLANGGVLAVPSNTGTFSRNEFTLLPEGTINVGCDILPNVRLQAGYTFLYWPGVLRVGDHISRGVDLRQVPTSASFNPLVAPNNPGAPTLRESDLILHGFSLGITLSF